MNKIKSSYHYYNIEKIINEDGILSLKIDTSMIEAYQQAIQCLRQYLNLQLIDDRTYTFLKFRIIQTLKIINTANSDLSINLVVKKLLFLQFFIRWGCEKNLINSEIIQVLTKEIQIIIKDDLSKLSKNKSKSFMSLERIGTFFRQLSASKRDSSKMKFQQLSQKQAVRQTVSNILEPYCFYLLKVLANYETYNDCFKKRQNIGTQTMWKLINWSIVLSKIVYNLHKMGRYFGDDFKGVWIICCYIISQDESVFYEISKQKIEKESQKWLEKFNISNKKMQMDRRSYSQHVFALFTKEQLESIVSLKRQIDQMNKIKEGLNYLYLNKCLKEWRCYFKNISLKVVKLNKSQQTSSDQLLILISTLAKYKQFSSIFSDHSVDNHSKRGGILSSRSQAQSQQIRKNLNQTAPTAKEMLETDNIDISNYINTQSKPAVRKNTVFAEKRNRILGRI